MSLLVCKCNLRDFSSYRVARAGRRGPRAVARRRAALLRCCVTGRPHARLAWCITDSLGSMLDYRPHQSVDTPLLAAALRVYGGDWMHPIASFALTPSGGPTSSYSWVLTAWLQRLSPVGHGVGCLVPQQLPFYKRLYLYI